MLSAKLNLLNIEPLDAVIKQLSGYCIDRLFTNQMKYFELGHLFLVLVLVIFSLAISPAVSAQESAQEQESSKQLARPVWSPKRPEKGTVPTRPGFSAPKPSRQNISRPSSVWGEELDTGSNLDDAQEPELQENTEEIQDATNKDAEFDNTLSVEDKGNLDVEYTSVQQRESENSELITVPEQPVVTQQADKEELAPVVLETLGSQESSKPAEPLVPDDTTQTVEQPVKLVFSSMSPPEYPARALRKGVEGWVEVEFSVNARGRVTDVVVIESQPGTTFIRETLRALKKWRVKTSSVSKLSPDQRFRRILRFKL